MCCQRLFGLRRLERGFDIPGRYTDHVNSGDSDHCKPCVLLPVDGMEAAVLGSQNSLA